LGDPGSGKTTLLRWLAVQPAESGLEPQGEQVQVPVYQIDPEAAEDAHQFIDLGPKRILIFVRVAAFAERRRQPGNETLRLADYIGDQPIYGRG
jgi:predicted NACHT family NTPase